jgi:hypothetical protein
MQGTITVVAALAQGNPSAATVCYNTARTFTLAAATGGSGVTYQWQQSSNNTTWTNATGTSNGQTYTTPALTGNMYYRRIVTDAACGAATSTSALVTARANFTAGAITTASGNASTGVAPGITIASATSAGGGDGTITYKWERTGQVAKSLATNTATYAINNDASNYAVAGVYYFTRYAHDGTCNTDWTASTGQYTLTVATPPPPGSGTNTWACGAQTWSGALRQAVGTSSSSWPAGSATTAYYYSGGSPDDGYYYNWKNVADNAETLCPYPWRVPYTSDFGTLDRCFGGTGYNRTGVPLSTWIGPNYILNWGGTWGGYFDGTSITTGIPGGDSGHYCILNSEAGIIEDDRVYNMQFNTDGGVYPTGWFSGQENNYGFQLRCVRP